MENKISLKDISIVKITKTNVNILKNHKDEYIQLYMYYEKSQDKFAIKFGLPGSPSNKSYYKYQLLNYIDRINNGEEIIYLCILKNSDKLIGFQNVTLSCFLDGSNNIHLDHIYVSSQYNGNGIGTYIIKYVLSQFPSKIIFLSTYTNNFPIMHVVKKIGFKIFMDQENISKEFISPITSALDVNSDLKIKAVTKNNINDFEDFWNECVSYTKKEHLKFYSNILNINNNIKRISFKNVQQSLWNKTSKNNIYIGKYKDIPIVIAIIKVLADKSGIFQLYFNSVPRSSIYSIIIKQILYKIYNSKPKIVLYYKTPYLNKQLNLLAKTIGFKNSMFLHYLKN